MVDSARDLTGGRGTVQDRTGSSLASPIDAQVFEVQQAGLRQPREDRCERNPVPATGETIDDGLRVTPDYTLDASSLEDWKEFLGQPEFGETTEVGLRDQCAADCDYLQVRFIEDANIAERSPQGAHGEESEELAGA
jgi:hypothetical protein